jgi:hypothetical protein
MTCRNPIATAVTQFSPAVMMLERVATKILRSTVRETSRPCSGTIQFKSAVLEQGDCLFRKQNECPKRVGRPEHSPFRCPPYP